jgi:hypothetical protein
MQHPSLGSVVLCAALSVATGCAWLPAQLGRFARSNAAPERAERSAIRPSATFYYIVERGDTLSRIARRVGTSVEDLARDGRGRVHSALASNRD